MASLENVLLPPVTDEARLAARMRPTTMMVGRQRWTDLLFLHWQVEPAEVQATLPPGLTVDTHQGAAYVGIVPFFMKRVRPRWLPPLPWLSWFMELNVRTYVHDAQGRPGVWFYSLDCDQPIAVWLARKAFHLPYFHAAMSSTVSAAHIDYHCQRKSGVEDACHFAWQAKGKSGAAALGSLEFFLVERYYLFARSPDGRIHTGQVHHDPYRVRDAQVFAYSKIPGQQAGFELPGPPASMLCADPVDVSIYGLKPVS